ncbi:Mps one binder kinase activator-like 3 [Trachymyrmex cornetzi]|uniref:Mps one binder kinase activator-like 3 n=1 Tax=Trachymyrmex cornetzi TaxID=471704 RepID=A0A151JNC7_9HYME|nr:Mps one binder kinase activator-like 3 [Trachymyrmex cornetzi]
MCPLLEAHVNTCYKHFYYFVTEFDLINSKELEPLVEMTAKVCKDSISPTQNTAPSSNQGR